MISLIDKVLYTENGGKTVIYKNSVNSVLKGEYFYSKTIGWFQVKKVWVTRIQWKETKNSPWKTYSYEVMKVTTTNGETFVLPKAYLDKDGAFTPQTLRYMR